MSNIQVLAPHFGIEGAKVIEILVKPGDTIRVDDSIIVLENEKTITELPSSHAGQVETILVKVGDVLGEGACILELAGNEKESQTTAKPQLEEKKSLVLDEPQQTPNSNCYDVCVIGGGPGGYTAAFRAADLGLKVCLVERYPVLGGVCLNVGCIPSKTLLHVARVIEDTRHSSGCGVSFSPPKIDVDKLRSHKQGITDELIQGLSKMARLRKIDVKHGEVSFKDKHTIIIKSAEKSHQPQEIGFSNAIIAVGSSVNRPNFVPKHENLWDSTDALALRKIPQTMLIIGGGIIGLEMAAVYHALGTKITIVELGGQIIPQADKDSVLPLLKRIKRDYENVWTNTKVTKIIPQKNAIEVHFEGTKAPDKQAFEVVLTVVGRSPNGKKINAESIGIDVDEQGFIDVDLQQRTNIENIYAVGDVVGEPMLAHKATHQAKVAAEVIAGEAASFSVVGIPSVAYTHPEVAWVGYTEKQLKEQGIEYVKGVFPWQANGRSLSSGEKEGFSKTMFCKKTNRLIGASIVGSNAGELIAEAVLALEMGADAKDISLSVHPHPTLSETFAMAAEIVDGSITDIIPPKPRTVSPKSNP